MNVETRYYQLADLQFKIEFRDTTLNSSNLLPSMEPFAISAPTEKLLFEMTVDDTLPVIAKSRRDRIRDFETGNGNTIIDRIDGDNGYQFIVSDLRKNQCCMFQTNKDFSRCDLALNGNYDMRKFGITNALMMTFAYASSYYNTVMIHASLVRHKGYGYAFCAPSGTGKSTQVSNWLRYIPDCDLMNDDNPVIRVIDGKPYVYGSPWSGKTPCYRNVKAPLGGLTRIDQAKKNEVEKLNPIEAFTSTIPSCTTMRWDHEIFNNVCSTVTKLVETTGIYILHCLPDRDSAIVCHDRIAVVK